MKMRSSEALVAEQAVTERRRKPTAATGLQIAEFLAQNPHGMRLREIAAEVQMDPGQIHRILSIMLEDGWVIPVGEDGTYALSPRIIRLSSTYINRLDLSEHARPFLNELAHKTKESVFLGQLRKDVIVCVGRRVADHALRVWTEMGDHWPVAGTAVGAAVTAARYARLGPDFYPRDMPEEVALALERGYARDFGRYREGVQAVAAPIRDASGVEIGALSVAGPVARIGDREIEKLAPMVLETAGAISAAIGYQADSD